MQRPTMLWYHDHTLGITALNTAAGMVGLYIIRDPQGEERRLKRWLPRGERQLHLVLADRSFFPNGSINYPNQGFVPNVHPNWIPGYVGNTNVVNGKVWPFLNVRRAMHRIRMLSAANARTYNLTFQCAGRGDHNFNPPLAGPVLPFYLASRARVKISFLLDFHAARAWCPIQQPLQPSPTSPSPPFPSLSPTSFAPGQIGSDGGYLTCVTTCSSTSTLHPPGALCPLPPSSPPGQIGSDGGYLARPLRRSFLLVVPGTRHDLLLDFNAAPGWCRDVIIVNSASIPFPVGQPADWFTGVVMRFIINQRSPVKPPALPNKLSHIPPVNLTQAVKQRWLAISFIIDPVSQKPSGMLLDGKTYMDPATEKPKVGTSELWHIINPTFETHPMHLHLVQHRPISRRPINSGGLINGSCSLAPSSPFKPSCFTGPARPVPQHERGWKDTTVAFPDSVLTIFVPFKGQNGKPFPFDATEGPGYAWHCHALEHEDNDMMRPLIMTA
ncbi:unnamed protein product [Closterium sp. NIES-54]